FPHIICKIPPSIVYGRIFRFIALHRLRLWNHRCRTRPGLTRIWLIPIRLWWKLVICSLRRRYPDCLQLLLPLNLGAIRTRNHGQRRDWRRRLIWRTWLVVALFDCIKVDLKRGVRLVARSPCYCRWCIKGLGVVSAANLCQHPFLDGFSTFHCFTRTTPSICDVSERTRL